MKSNLKFFLALGSAKLIMLNSSGENYFYSRNSCPPFKKDLSKIVDLLKTKQ